MKLMHILNSTVLASFILLTIVGINGCKRDGIYDPDKDKTILPPASDYFNFNTTEQLNLHVDYGIPGYKVAFAVYTEDPTEYIGEELQKKEGVSPVFEAYTDDNCKYEGIITLPTTVKNIYLCSDNLFVPQCIEIEVQNGEINYPIQSTTQALTKADSKLTYVKEGDAPIAIGTLYSLCEWGKHGELPKNYISMATDLGNNQSTGSLFKRVQSKLAAKNTSNKKQNNSNLVSTEEYTNISISTHGANGTTIDGANIDLVFLHERAGYKSTLGYYYYKTTDLKNGLDIAQLPKYVIFPNVSQGEDDPYNRKYFSSDGKYLSSSAPLKQGNKIRLKYFGENGKSAAQDKFPSGYTIGWFIIPNGYQVGQENIDTRNGYYYSNVSANKDRKSRCITVFDKQSQKMIVGFEDGDDNSFEDILFYVDSNPIEAIVDPEKPGVPSIDDEKDPIEIPDKTNMTTGTLAFEDIWPSGGDYDMNDVIIEYKTEVTFNKDNKIKKIVETFTPVHDGATFTNAFGYQVPEKLAEGDVRITLSNGVEMEAGQSLPTYLVFQDTKAAVKAGNSYTITRDFPNPLSYETIDAATLMSQYNPFILPQYQKGNQHRREIHLPKYKSTDFADLTLIGTAKDAYYVDREGAYPFAIHIPISGFKPVTEKERIDSENEYPDFRRWADSFGSEAQDWYNNYKKK